MKRAKKRTQPLVKPRNPLSLSPLLSKGAAHQRRDKRASRARLKAAARRELVRSDCG